MENNMPLLQMKHISKSFPGVKALDRVNLEVHVGEVHALLGENGAGKSTLIKILGGILVPDEGEIIFDGNKVEIKDVSFSESIGISVIHQELCLAPNMTVAENIVLGREPSKGPLQLVNRKEIIRYGQKILDQFELDIDAGEYVSNLTVAQQQMVEIAKALSKDNRIIVMDEPTSSLTEKEVIKLLETIRGLRLKGVSVIYISHRMEELFAIADKVTVLRDGTYVATRDMKDTSYQDLVRLMVGRELSEIYTKPVVQPGEKIFEVRNLSSGTRVKNVSFSLYKGEILGFYGLVGSGRTELMRTIFGIDKSISGDIYLNQKKIRIKNPKDAIQSGIGFVPEDRKEQGAILIQSISYNISLSVLDSMVKFFQVDRRKEETLVDKYIERLSIRTPSPEQQLMNLSGGNQQKVIIAKWLAMKPDILILDEPTRGIDVGAKKEIYSFMSILAQSGVSIIMVSSELPEIINMSTRVMTMYQGEISGELTMESEITQENILIHATGGVKNESSS
ncbi:ATP-binding cassette domain-containing protein [Paenibacillus sp. LMG 31460]|uniref:ATP-binding cassette domain-containing protein n=1 Tax=Paenibacillus germinis TaxID=2654979 RepID=A0ABX1ZBW5_9BACL|nr:sugar ABC transporter ATP-binding protein [Paenibacillus germinis]NOU90821.1 ATP-binding cassette domain-containing protein [Paenibacillus germinis]